MGSGCELRSDRVRRSSGGASLALCGNQDLEQVSIGRNMPMGQEQGQVLLLFAKAVAWSEEGRQHTRNPLTFA